MRKNIQQILRSTIQFISKNNIHYLLNTAAYEKLQCKSSNVHETFVSGASPRVNLGEWGLFTPMLSGREPDEVTLYSYIRIFRFESESGLVFVRV